jgi:uncharacterized membrane protein YhhN
MLNKLIVFSSIALLSALLYNEKHQNLKNILVTKTTLSCLFIVAALVQPHPDIRYFQILLGGLIFCLAGDIFLALQHERMFFLGLVSFLTGHLFYVACFFYVTGMTLWTLAGLIITGIVGRPIYGWLKPNLGDMKLPVIAYIVIISLMVGSAVSILGYPTINLSGRAMVFFGALLFYVSDIFVARQRFIKDAFTNRLIGLPLYYGGQFLLAFSVGLIK